MRILLFTLVCLLPHPTFAQDTFQLAKPLLRYSSIFFSGEAEVSLEFAQAGTGIFYTVNGKEPTKKDLRYSKPIHIRKNFTTLKAKVYGAGFLPSETVAATLIKTGVTIISLECSPPNPKYPAKGAQSLHDAQGGNSDIDCRNWLGYDADTAVFMLNLAKKQSVGSILLNCLQKEGGWIFLPQQIKAEAWSETQNAYVEMDTQYHPAGTKEAPEGCVQELLHNPQKMETRRIRITVIPLRSIPDWHAGKGRPAWFFLDEIIVYP